MSIRPDQPKQTVGPFKVSGINHLALVCRDMQQTVDFYEGVLGFPLVKTIELPGDSGQHFFFDIGNGDCLAFFNFPNAPEAAPGVSSPDPNTFFDPSAELVTAVASMNHVAFNVAPEEIEASRQRLIDAGVRCTPILNHDDSDRGIARENHPGVFVRSVYFYDPDGIMLEFAAWTRAMRPEDVRHAPARAAEAVAVLAD
ncbi:MAG: VOC family protein [Chloroflexi bacterium]|nr:VOC family protein [Chloroflexota bacterium]